jgi:hypothetical protein
VPFYMRYMRWPLAYNGHSLTDYVNITHSQAMNMTELQIFATNHPIFKAFQPLTVANSYELNGKVDCSPF